MAIYHCRFKVHSRGSGAKAAQASAYRTGTRTVGRVTSAVRAAAYRSGGELIDAGGEVHDFTRKGGVVWNGILAPENAPGWVYERNVLWNRVEQAEKRKDAQLFREAELSLPRELDPTQRRALVQAFVKDQFVAKGMIADIGIHCPVASDGGEQPHAHVMLTMRDIGPDGFGPKNRDWNSRDLLKSWREQWETYCNAALDEAGSRERIDHRSLVDQGKRIEPMPHQGQAVHVEEARDGFAAKRDDLERVTFERRVAEARASINRARKPGMALAPAAPLPAPADPFERQVRAAGIAIAKDLATFRKRDAINEAGRLALEAARRLRFYAMHDEAPDPESIWGPSYDR